jgi:histidinol-phosphate/aromatic aminotransferase/cobyric acid decarboxylase-like protein
MQRPNWNSNKQSVCIDLSNNVCRDHVLFDKIHSELSGITAKDLLSYANEYCIYQTISNYYGYAIDQLAIGLGSTELIQRLIYHFKNHKVAILSPTFEMVRVYCDMFGVEYYTVNYYHFNIIDIESLTGHDVLYVANPNGNNGHAFDHEQIEYLIKNNQYVILDEAYIDYCTYSSCDSLVNMYPNLCILRSFSKTLGFAGMRCGFVYANKSFIEKIQSIRMNSVSTALSGYLLKNYIDEIPVHVKRMNDSKNWLNLNGFNITTNGNYVIVPKEKHKLFEWCKHKRLDDSYIRVTLTNIDTFIENIVAL